MPILDQLNQTQQHYPTVDAGSHYYIDIGPPSSEKDATADEAMNSAGKDRKGTLSSELKKAKVPNDDNDDDSDSTTVYSSPCSSPHCSEGAPGEEEACVSRIKVSRTTPALLGSNLHSIITEADPITLNTPRKDSSHTCGGSSDSAGTASVMDPESLSDKQKKSKGEGGEKEKEAHNKSSISFVKDARKPRAAPGTELPVDSSLSTSQKQQQSSAPGVVVTAPSHNTTTTTSSTTGRITIDVGNRNIHTGGGDSIQGRSKTTSGSSSCSTGGEVEEDADYDAEGQGGGDGEGSSSDTEHVTRHQDDRSIVVTMSDVDIAMAKFALLQQQQRRYYNIGRHLAKMMKNQQARQKCKRGAYSTNRTRGHAGHVDSYCYYCEDENDKTDEAGSSFLESHGEEEELYAQSRVREVESLVEQYLCTSGSAAALAQFRLHLPIEEKLLRTPENTAVFGARVCACSNDILTTAPCSANSSGRDSVNGLTRADEELLALDAARRARFLDDTVPWRPVRWESSLTRLEPIELPREYRVMQHARRQELLVKGSVESIHPGSGGGGSAVGDVSGGMAIPSAFGGSLKLLMETITLSEVDPPFTATGAVPAANNTSMFLLLASLFVVPDVLVVKFIRMFRSIRRWHAQHNLQQHQQQQQQQAYSSMSSPTALPHLSITDLVERAVYLERRVLQCLTAYCRAHEADLTADVLCRLACFIESCGAQEGDSALTIRNPLVGLFPRALIEGGAWRDGVLDPWRLRQPVVAAHQQQQSYSGFAQWTTPLHVSSPSTVNSFYSRRHYHHHASQSLSASGSPGLGDFYRTCAPSPPLPPLQAEVAQDLAELANFVQCFAKHHYTVASAPVECETRGAPAATASGGGTQWQCLRSTGKPRRPLGALYVRGSDRSGGGGCEEGAFGEIGATLSEDAFSNWGREDQSNGKAVSMATFPDKASAFYFVATRPDKYSQGSTRNQDKQSLPKERAAISYLSFSPVDISAQHFSEQLSILFFSLFASINLRELLNTSTTWQDPLTKKCVASRFEELTHFALQVQLWSAAVMVVAPRWSDCCQACGHMLEVCRVLYDLQCYEAAAAVFAGLMHPAVQVLQARYEEEHSSSASGSGSGGSQQQRMLNATELRELDTLRELMDPFASYSPSSLNSVYARAAGDMDSPMIPLLAPILEVLYRIEENRGPTVFVRDTDGQRVINWTKIMAMGRVATLLLRCQSRPYNFPIDPQMQEYLWYIKHHQWTDEALARMARRQKG